MPQGWTVHVDTSPDPPMAAHGLQDAVDLGHDPPRPKTNMQELHGPEVSGL